MSKKYKKKLPALPADKLAQVDCNKPLWSQAKALGLPYYRLRKWMQDRGHKPHPRGRPKLCDWENLDWTLCSAELARQLKCEPSTVTSQRNRLDKPLGTIGRRKPARAPRIIIKDLDMTLRDHVLAKQHGCSREYIRQVRKQLGLPSSRTLSKPDANASPQG
jgi:hypothetical protein